MPGVFTYKMTIGAEYGGKVIELVSTTPGVSIFPPSQIVPAGGGVLEWTIFGAVPGMTINLVANGLTDGDVKHVAGPKEGLGLCCVQKIEIVIPIDIDCPPEEECQEGDPDCPPKEECKEGDPDCPPEEECKPGDPKCPPPCDPEWEDCPCDPEVEKCDPPVDKKPDLRLGKLAIDPWCHDLGDGTANCVFAISIWNAGDAPFNGPVTVRDRYPNGAPISSTFNPTPPWVCGPDGAADKFVCTGNINLPPLAETFITVNAIVSIADYPSRDVKNCALLEEQAGQPESCAIAKLPDPDNPTNRICQLSKVCINADGQLGPKCHLPDYQ